MIKPKILVLGEVFIDCWYTGTADRLSPEAPLAVVKVQEVIQKPGGAGNVAANLRALGADVTLLDPVGHKPIKNRLVANGHQIARWDQNDTVEPYTPQFLDYCKNAFDIADAVILSDYSKGVFSAEVIDHIAYLTSNPAKVVCIDTKRSPELYKAIDFPVWFPNLKEYTQFQLEYDAQQAVILKKGAEGCSRLEKGKVLNSYPSYSKNPINVAGAGDSVVAAYLYASLVLEHGSPLIFAMKAAAVAIGKPLTSTATLNEIEQLTS
jgi:D-beta-D-heptose 7-phosphate kinase / D-beta-D-heptose 1-phosphate adenosyltransferase